MTIRQPHFLLASEPGWQAGLLDKAVLAGDGNALELRRIPGPPVPLVDATGSFGGLSLPAAVAVDDGDRVYILDAQSDLVKRFDPCTRTFETMDCIGGTGSEPRQIRGGHGLAISPGGDLFVADSGNRRVQVFALDRSVLRRVTGPLQVVHEQQKVHVRRVAPLAMPPPDPACGASPIWPAGTWLPWDVAVSPSGVAYVTDYANGLVHVFDRLGAWRAGYDGATGGGQALQKPTRLALDACARIYVVQEGADYVTVLAPDGSFLGIVRADSDVEGRFCPVAVAVDPAGVLHVCDEGGTLALFTPADGGFTSAGSCPAPAQALAFDRSGNPVLADPRTKQIVQMTAGAAYETDGTYISKSLDSRQYQCEWDRVELLANVQPGTQITVDTFTSESNKTLAEIAALPDDRWATGQVDSGEISWDCMLLSPPGRYLWLRLKLVGRGADTPSISRARVFYPRVTSRQYLPAVFSEDPSTSGFLDRFLSIFDSIRNQISDQVGEIAHYFDPAATPADAPLASTDFLTWLASWIGLSLERRWPEEKRRRLLKEAYRLYRLRGTPAGLRLHVQLYTGVEPRILEHFTLRRWLFLDDARLGEQSQLWGPEVIRRLQLDEFASIGSFQLMDDGDPLTDPFYQFAHRFTLFVPLSGGDATDRLTLERIVQLAKPAHTDGFVQVVEPRFRVGIQSFIGVDTVIGRYPAKVTTGEGLLGQDTVLGPSADDEQRPSMKIGSRSRVGSTTVLD